MRILPDSLAGHGQGVELKGAEQTDRWRGAGKAVWVQSHERKFRGGKSPVGTGCFETTGEAPTGQTSWDSGQIVENFETLIFLFTQNYLIHSKKAYEVQG